MALERTELRRVEARAPTEQPAETTIEYNEHPERGQGMVEYAFIIALIVLVLILIVTVLGTQTKNLYSNISNGFAGH